MKYSAIIDTLIIIKHINNLLDNEEYASNIVIAQMKDVMMHVLHFHDVKIWKDLYKTVTKEEEHNKINFYIKLYELAEKGRIEIFTMKDGDI